MRLGKVFERLRVNPDYKELFKYVASQIQMLSNIIINGQLKKVEDMVDDAFNKGRNIGLAESEAHMMDVIKVMKEEEVRLAKKEKENA